MLRIVIAGDTCPIGRNQPLFREGNAQALLGDLLPEFEQADLSIVNLECPLIREESPIQKIGPNLGAPIECVKGLKAMGIDVVGLANNHVMDHGPQGLRTTIQTLEQEGIAHVGAGENLAAARKILVRQIGAVRIGVLAVAEHEFGIAERTEPGVNPLDIIDVVRNIRDHRDTFDFLIVLLHGGNEHYPYPRPSLLDTCRFLVEQGANAVICQHSHCAGCMETYRGAPIVYGQGNLLFDLLSEHRTWHEGMLVSLDLDATGHSQIRLVPFKQSDGSPGAHRMTTDQERHFRRAFDERSAAILSKSFVENQWMAFCRQQERHYLSMIHGRRSLIRRVAGKLNLLDWLDSPKVHRMRYHAITCESHREALITLLSMKSGLRRPIKHSARSNIRTETE